MRHLLAWSALLVLCLTRAAAAESMPEYRVKAGFLYNFAAFTKWPADKPGTLTLCVYGHDPFGEFITALNDKKVGSSRLVVQTEARLAALDGCQMVFIADSKRDGIPAVVAQLSGKPVLTVADSPAAASQGVMLNMTLDQGRVRFEINQGRAVASNLALSSKLLKLATKVYP